MKLRIRLKIKNERARRGKNIVTSKENISAFPL
jgi:hypothetical protein